MRRVFRPAIVAAAALALFGCDLYPDAPPPKPRPSGARVEAADFVRHLSLAWMANAENDEVSQADVKAARDYASRQRKAKAQTVALITYKTGLFSGQRKIAAPAHTEGKPEFPALVDALTRLGDARLHDITLRRVNVAPERPVKSMDDAQTRQWIDREHAALLASAAELGVEENLRGQILLTRFFLASRYRDAAYLAMDNAKQALAAAAQKRSMNETKIDLYTKELETLERELREQMPFNL